MGRGRAKRSKRSIGKDASGSEPYSEAAVDGGEGSEAATYPNVLSPELMAQLGVENAEDAVAPVKLKGKKRKRVNRETKELAESISKSKAKKLKQLEEKKIKDGRRAELYRKLNSNSLAPEQLSLLQSSKTISQSHETLRSRMKQAVQRAVAGIELESDILAELESHPGLVADIEELLALPVGGALAAVRKTQVDSSKDGVKEGGGTAGSKAGKSNTVRTANMRANDGVKRKAGKEARQEEAMTTTVASKEPSDVLPAVAQSHTSRSTVVANAERARNLARAAPPPVEVVSIRPGSPSSDSEVDSDSGDDDEQEQEGKSTEFPGSGSRDSDDAVDDEAYAPGGEEGSDGNSVGVASQDSVESLARGKPEKGSTAATSAASWAEKMMSSLARFPTASITSTPAANHDPSDASESNSELKATPSPLIKGPNPTHTENSVDARGAADSTGGDEAAPMHYPPLPDWVQGNAAPYVAVETPLPSASGGSTAPFPRPKRWIPVKRSVELQAARMLLPVCGMEQEIVEAIHDHDAVILCGETGSGKSTQVPQFLYEAGYGAYGVIGVTQPRRVAAVSTAERVAVELGTRCGRGGEVAYQIRYDASGVGPRTRVKFMTDGVLLQEITSDILLRKYSVVILDEAHERNLNTDVLLGMLSRSIPLRKKIADEEQRAWSMLSEESKNGAKPPSRPLKLVIMSATLRVSDFTENAALFQTPPPVITVKSRQHPVTVHFNRRTELYDYVGETFRKVCKVHRRLPDGGILVFLTGKREILHMSHKLRKEFPAPKVRKGKKPHSRNGDVADRTGEASTEKVDTRRRKRTGRPVDSGGKEKDAGSGEGGSAEAVIGNKRARQTSGGDSGSTDPGTSLNEKPRETNKENLLYREADDDEEDAARLADMEHDQSNPDGDEDVVRDSFGEGGAGGAGDEAGDLSEDEDPSGEGFGLERGEMAEEVPPIHVVPLYAMLTAEEQAKVFRTPPDGHRLIVVATNVAETSITIPGISYVVDCGRQKRRVIQRGSGISKFEVGWISKASADQRAGRAGRTGPGHCYRLYSSALYTDTMEAFAPPEVLTRPLEDVMLQMKSIGIGDVSRFPFPTPPDAAGLRAAAALLASLGATVSVGRRGQGSPSGVAGNDDGKITAVGKALALLPVGVRYAKMLLLAVQGSVLAHAIAMVAMLTEGDPFVRPDGAVAKGGGDGDDDGEADREGGGDSNRGGDVEESRGASTGLDEDEARQRRAQWLHPTSDALARLKAAGAYAHTTSGGTTVGGGEFCRENSLHAPTMERALNLRLQLSRLANLRFGSEEGWEECRVSKSLRPPDVHQTDALRQVLLSGLLDNVARRAPAGTVTAGSRLQRNCAYLSCNEAVKEPLYIKNTSVLFSREPTELPEWVVYQDIVRGERDGAPARMTCVTAIEPFWIPSIAADSPLLSFSDPLVSPPPTYDEAKHTVMCRVTPRYGVHAWELPSHSMEMVAASPPQKPDLVFRWFGRLLLEGRVKGLLSSLKADGILNDPPSLLTRELPSKKALVLLLELRQKGVSSLPALAEQWRSNRSYLRTSLRLWIKVGCAEAFERAWSAAQSTVLQME